MPFEKDKPISYYERLFTGILMDSNPLRLQQPAQQRQFLEEGGIRERMAKARRENRGTEMGS